MQNRDTVSSIGLFRSTNLPDITRGMLHVCFFRHALAQDERRVKFLPEFAFGGSSLPDAAEQRSELQDKQLSLPHTKEVWFSGSHSDVCVHHDHLIFNAGD